MVDFFDLVIFLLPIYVANSIPVLLGGGTPLDLGLIMSDKRRLFGNGKTIRGFVAGVLGGTVVGGLITNFYLLPFFLNAQEQFVACFLLSIGTMTGDAVGSFIKRRFGFDAGKPFVLDTFLFVVVALIIVFPLARLSLYDPFNVIFFLVITLVLHPLTNAIANKLGLKKVPW